MKKEKKWYDVKLEVLMPATVVYRVLAENEESALDEIKVSTIPTSVKYQLLKKKNIKATIYDAGSSMIRYIKNFGAK